ncbi:hypothetical protein [Pseudorhodobacter sp. E13]|uniref:hypothetical protein n=1 Tax=Pseudorhodobacter sp. E13 TaxID=2487931 RepID=UPI0013156E32|nr:hypothetical protein [Pseudorhodobacter sp. E13]
MKNQFVLRKPEYRIRLFLSVDLTGSTNFKSSDSSTFRWLKAFQKFYGEFPALFQKKYVEVSGSIPDLSADEKAQIPKVWKTVGDEILFVNRVHSITQLGAYVSAFSGALKEFGQEIHGIHKLNTKGNAWVAAFPSPNCSISLSIGTNQDPISGGNELLTEDFERKVDETPRDYDFLGKGIDSGFRIARNSSVLSLTLVTDFREFHRVCPARGVRG